MKNLFLILIFIITGCTCNAQLQSQYLYVDENCEAILPDYTVIVRTSDNCGDVSLNQIPYPGSVVSANLNVTIQAVDESGNMTDGTFTVFLLDTIAPILEWPDSVILSLYLPVERWIITDQKEFMKEFIANQNK